MKAHSQTHFLNMIHGKGMISSLLRNAMLPLSWGFRFAVAARNWAFDKNFLRSYTSPVPLVISVGNIVAGGTGKTPVTLLLAQEFYSDIPMAILSRGYRSLAEKKATPTILSNGSGPLYSAKECGDEPYFFAQHLPKAHVIVGKDRCAAAHIAVQTGAKVLLLDDGMQHRHIVRDYDIIVMNAKNLFGYGHFLPRGLLREAPKALSRASLIVLNHVKDEQHYAELVQEVVPYTSAPIVGVRMVVKQLINHQGEQVKLIQGKRVGLFCGIANPDQFQQVIEEQGAYVIASKFFPDHHDFQSEEIIKFAKRCAQQGAEALVCTEKDFVKLSNMPALPLPLIYLQMDLGIVSGKEHWQSFIENAKKKLDL